MCARKKKNRRVGVVCRAYLLEEKVFLLSVFFPFLVFVEASWKSILVFEYCAYSELFLNLRNTSYHVDRPFCF